jgi:LAIKA domain
LKNQLVARLVKALKVEADPSSNGEVEEGEDVEMVDADVPSSQEQNVEEVSQEKKDEVETEMNIAEMDMSEVTIIDEYDSTKCEEEKTEKPREKKKEEPRKLDEKERHQIEKRYQLPENPHIVVHPSKNAKSGKFDCTVMSLSVLLDYRPEDTKEHSFEVSLFAELFNEMLTRDFGFNIFKAINYFPAIKAKEESKDDKKETKTADGEASSPEEKSTESSEKKESEAEAPKEDDKKDKKRSHPEDSDDSSMAARSDRSRSKRDKDGKETKVERPKYITAFPDLLLSFVYFDQNHCGYMFEKDLEDLFYTLGLNLSRSQVRKMAEKFVTRDSLYYRKLTDRLAEVPYVNPFENVSEEQLAELARGNQIVKPSEVALNAEVANVDACGGLVQFNGSLVNIQQLLDQMRRSEAARESTERILVDLRQKNGDLTTTNSRNDKRIKDLNSDLKSMSRKLQDTESSLNSATVS